MLLGPTIQDNKMNVTLHDVKNPRLLFPCQMSVALQEGLLSMFNWYSKPNSCTYIEPDSKISPSCPITYFWSYSTWSLKSIGNKYGFWEVTLHVNMSDPVQYTCTIDAGHQ